MKKAALHFPAPPKSRKLALCGDPAPLGLSEVPSFVDCPLCQKACKLSQKAKARIEASVSGLFEARATKGPKKKGKRS